MSIDCSLVAKPSICNASPWDDFNASDSFDDLADPGRDKERSKSAGCAIEVVVVLVVMLAVVIVVVVVVVEAPSSSDNGLPIRWSGLLELLSLGLQEAGPEIRHPKSLEFEFIRSDGIVVVGAAGLACFIFLEIA